MRIQLELDLTVTPRTKRAIKWFAIPFAVLAGSAAIAHAWTADTSWIANGQQLSASKLNAILSEADNRLKALEAGSAKPIYTNRSTGQQTTLFGQPCGRTSPTTGAVNDGAGKVGYQGARSLCQKVAGCTANAHMCTTLEVVAYMSTGGDPGGTYAWIASGSDGINPSMQRIDDCFGFTSAAATVGGQQSSSSGNFPNAGGCNTAAQILCCD
jgi:hypothetical protein